MRHRTLLRLCISLTLLLAGGIPSRVATEELPIQAALDYEMTVLLNNNERADCDQTRALLARGAWVNCRGKPSGLTPLMMGALWGDVGLFEEALNRGAWINDRESSGLTALIWAAKNGHPGIVRTLLTKGAKVDMETNAGNTALMYASAMSEVECVRLLLRGGANVNHRGQSGMTPLADATDPEIVRMLLWRGARTRVWDGENLTPLGRARRDGRADIVALLERAERIEINRARRRRPPR